MKILSGCCRVSNLNVDIVTIDAVLFAVACLTENEGNNHISTYYNY